ARRTTKRTAGQMSRDLLGARGLIALLLRLTDKDLGAARAQREAMWLVRPHDLDPIANERHAENLATAGQVVALRPRTIDEGDGHPVLAGRDLHRDVRQPGDQG